MSLLRSATTQQIPSLASELLKFITYHLERDSINSFVIKTLKIARNTAMKTEDNAKCKLTTFNAQEDCKKLLHKKIEYYAAIWVLQKSIMDKTPNTQIEATNVDRVVADMTNHLFNTYDHAAHIESLKFLSQETHTILSGTLTVNTDNTQLQQYDVIVRTAVLAEERRKREEELKKENAKQSAETFPQQKFAPTLASYGLLATHQKPFTQHPIWEREEKSSFTLKRS